MKEIKLDCNPKYAIREDGVVISYMYNNPRVMKTYKNKQGADIVDIRVDGKYKSVRIKTLIERYFPNPIPDGFKPIPGYGDRFYANIKGEILSDSAYSANNKGRRILKQSDNNGYKTVTINGKTMYVHRLIAITFIPNPNIVTGYKTTYRNKNHCSCELGCSVATISKHIKDKTNYKNYMFDYE